MSAFTWLWRTGTRTPKNHGVFAKVAHCVNIYRIRDEGARNTPALCGAKPAMNSDWSSEPAPVELPRCQGCVRHAKRRGVRLDV